MAPDERVADNMKTLGTICMYFPFMDSKTKSIIARIMKGAVNYGDFVRTLNNEVCEADAPDLAIFLAVHHAANLFDFDGLDRIANKYGHLLLIRPNLFIGSAFQGKIDDLQKAIASVNEFLELDSEEWLLVEMNLIKLEAEVLDYPRNVYDDASSDYIQEHLRNNPDLDMYRSRFLDTLAFKSKREGDMKNAFSLYEQAIESAKMHDDQNRLANLYRSKSFILQTSNMNESHELLRKSCSMLEEMGDKVGLTNSLFHLGKTEAIRGNYDAAIMHNLEISNIRAPTGMSCGAISLTLSTLYNLVGNSEAGLEWGRMAEAEYRASHKPRAILNQAWSLANLGNMSEAKDLIEQIQPSVFKSGLESQLAALYLVNGIMSLHECSFSDAAVDFEQALNIYEQKGALMSMNICLYFLAKNEVNATLDSSEGRDSIGPWLELCEERGRKEDMPGLLGQALLLKSRLYTLFGNQVDFDKCIEELQSLVQRNSLNYMDKYL